MAACRATDVAARLPGVLSTAIATSEHVAAANGLLAELHTPASELMVKLGNDQLAWTSADRALQAAHSTDDVLTDASARRAWAIVPTPPQWTETGDTARTLIGNHRFTAFGPTGVELYRISIARVQGDYDTAVETAQRVNPAGIALVERRARYWSDIARSFHEWNKPEQCYRALLATGPRRPPSAPVCSAQELRIFQ